LASVAVIGSKRDKTIETGKCKEKNKIQSNIGGVGGILERLRHTSALRRAIRWRLKRNAEATHNFKIMLDFPDP
jgi:hypothetical protein